MSFKGHILHSFLHFISWLLCTFPLFSALWQAQQQQSWLIINICFLFFDNLICFWHFYRLQFFFGPKLWDNIKKKTKQKKGKIKLSLYGYFVNTVYKTCVFIRTTLFLVNSCTYLEMFLFVWNDNKKKNKQY